jgi:hypothetical protein
MNNSKFWGAGSQSVSNGSSISNVPIQKKPISMKNFKVTKGIGITGAIIAVIVVVIATVSYLTLVRPTVSLLSAANVVKADANSIAKALTDRDLISLDKQLTKTEEDLKKLKNERESNFSWLKNIKLMKINEFYSDSDRFINAAFYSIEAVREMEKIVLPFADAAGLKVREDQQVQQAEGLMEAFQTWVSIMPEVAAQMDGVITIVAKIGDELAPIDTSKYPEKIKGIEIRSGIEFAKNTLSKADDYAPDVKNALIIFPKVLAVGTPTKRYMIIMQNDKEIRPTGGFMTNYATFKIQNALLQSDFTSKDMYSIDLTLDIIDATYDFPDPPAPYGKYLKVERWYARDMNFSPDLPISMDQFMKFYSMAGRLNPYEVKPVDGIFAIDTEVVRKLLEVTGPVTLNGVTYTSDNVVLELEKIASLELREQTGRKKVLGNLMQSMLINVFESDKNLWSKLINAGVELALNKHAQVYLFDPEAQVLVEKYGYAGRIEDPVKGDYSLVVSTNLGGDKTNWFVKKEVEQSLEKSGDRWMRTVKIKYSYPQPSADFSPFIKGFKDWVRVYAPAGSEFISVDGTEDGTLSDQERGKVWFSGYVELAPDQTKELTFKYYLPAQTINNGVWDLRIQKQAGIASEVYKIITSGKTKQIDLSRDTSVSTKL